MRTWNKAIVCLAALSIQAQAAMPVVQLKTRNDAKVLSQSISLEMLSESPELLDQLNLSDSDRRDLMNQIIIHAEEKRDAGRQSSEDQGLIHNVQFFNFGGGGLFNQDQRPYSYNPPPAQQYQDYGTQVCDNTKKAKMPVPPPQPEFTFNQEDMKNADDWKSKNFDLVVLINKAEYGQDMKVWRRLKPEDKTLTLIKNGRETKDKNGRSLWTVSTGREHAEISICDAQQLNIPVDPSHAPKNSYWSQTPTGYYIPDYLHIDHVSSDWEGSAMDHAVFFDSNRGIATHKVPTGSENRLGSRASGACVRMWQNSARDLFWMVRSTGGPVSKDELAQNDFPHCFKKKAGLTNSPQDQQLAKMDRDACIARGKERRKVLNFANEYQLAKVSGLDTNQEWPQVPQITRDGRCKFPGADEKNPIIDDCSKEGALTRQGFRTLYVVEDRFIPKPVPQKKQQQPKKTPVAQAPAARKPLVLQRAQ